MLIKIHLIRFLQGSVTEQPLRTWLEALQKPIQAQRPQFGVIDARHIEPPTPTVTQAQIQEYEEKKKTWGSLAVDPHAKAKPRPKQEHKPNKRRETRTSKKASKLEAGQTNIMAWLQGMSAPSAPSSSSSSSQVTMTQPTTSQTDADSAATQ